MDKIQEVPHRSFLSGAILGLLLDADAYLLELVRYYGIAEAKLKAPRKTRPYNEARAAAAYLVREASKLSLTELGKYLELDVSSLTPLSILTPQAHSGGGSREGEVVAFRV